MATKTQIVATHHALERVAARNLNSDTIINDINATATKPMFTDKLSAKGGKTIAALFQHEGQVCRAIMCSDKHYQTGENVFVFQTAYRPSANQLAQHG